MKDKRVLLSIALLSVHSLYLWATFGFELQAHIEYYVLFNILTALAILIHFIRVRDLDRYMKNSIVYMQKGLATDRIDTLPHPGSSEEMELFVRQVNRVIEYMNRKCMTAQSFNANVAHEMKAPLAQMRTKLEYSLYFSPLRKEIASEIYEFMQKIDDLENIVSQMLHISNNNVENLNISMSRVLLNDILSEAVDAKLEEMRRKNLTIDTEINQAVSIHGHTRLLFHAIGNIIDNAIKYSAHEGRIRISLRKKRNFISLIVSDCGMGIEKKELALIANPYYRGENVSSKSAGYGLGLTLAAWIFELHGASLKIRSQIGRGTFVRVKFSTG